MKILGAIRSVAIFLAVAFFVAAPVSPAQAQDRRAMREREHERSRFQTQHWAWDNRFNHNHYYPAIGYSVPSLPVGYISTQRSGSRYFFHSGVWFQFTRGSYWVVRPPLGLMLATLPTGYTTLWAGGVPYYYANDVYYASTPNGYVVAAPPEDANWQTQAPQPMITQQPQPQYNAPPSNPNQPAAAVWYYCDSARAYYPYVAACNEGWRTVPAMPPPAQ